MNRPTRFFSSKQEHKVAKDLGGKCVPNSGAATFYAGDVVIPNTMLIECKTCTKEQSSFTIKKDWLEKNEEEAFETHLPYSALAFDFGDQKEQHYIINAKLFRKLVNLLKEEQDI